MTDLVDRQLKSEAWTVTRESVNVVAQEVRKFLKGNNQGYRGKGRDHHGNRVNVHRNFDKPYQDVYITEIIYESTDWAHDFAQWWEGLSIRYDHTNIEVTVWTDHIIMVEVDRHTAEYLYE